MAITKADYESEKLGLLDREAYLCNFSEKPHGSISRSRQSIEPTQDVENYAWFHHQPVMQKDQPLVHVDTKKGYGGSRFRWCDSSEEISRREMGVGFRGFARRPVRRR